jgi:HEAT repeat protein
MRIFLMAMLVLSLAGCGKGPPTMAGGKPVRYWVEALQSSDVALRKKAVFKLGNAGPADAAVFPALVEALKDPDPQVRAEAIRALAKCGHQARKAIGELTELERQDGDAAVRAAAARLLTLLQDGRSAGK